MRKTSEVQAAIDGRKPVVVPFSDGRKYEFPPDVDAGEWLAFNATWGDAYAAGRLPPSGTDPYFRMLMGDHLDVLLADKITVSELRGVADRLHAAYFGAGDESEGDDESGDNPPE